MSIDTSRRESNQAVGVTSLNVPYPSVSGQGQAPDASNSAYVAILWSWSGFGVPAHTTPTGWTLIESATISGVTEPGQTGEQRISVYQKNYDASTGSITFALSLTSSVIAWVSLNTGVNTASPAQVSVFDTAGQKTFQNTQTTPSITTPLDNCVVISAWFGEHQGNSIVPVEWQPTAAMETVYNGFLTTSAFNKMAAGYIGVETKGTAGAISRAAKFAQFVGSFWDNTVPANACMANVALNPYQGPSAPALVQPNGGESIIVGLTYPITWLPATDPNTAQASLTYKVDYSANNGVTWVELEDATAGGATSYNWNTAGRTPGTQYLVRVRASDGTNAGPFDTSAAVFSLVADVAPGAPTNLSPNGGVFDRAQAKLFTWVFNDTGDTQSAYQLQASTNGFATTPIDTGKVTSTTASRNISGSTFSHANYQWRVRTWDFADTVGPYSAAASFLAGDKPSAPNITAPTAGSPPTTSTPTHSWTASGQVARRIRIEVDGSEIYTSGKVVSTAVSIPSPINYADGVEYELFISIFNSDDLESDPDSETFTPAFTGPDQPVLVITPVVSGGYIQASSENTDDPEGQELWRFVTDEGINSALRVAGDDSAIPANGTFRDYNVASGIEYSYFLRAFDSDGLITDSDVEDGTLDLDRCWIHVVQRDVASSNAMVAVGRGAQIPANLIQGYPAAQMRAEGRDRVVTVYGQARARQLTVLFRVGTLEPGVFAALEDCFDANGVVCLRDLKGNLLFGRLISLPRADFTTYSDLNVSVLEADYDEGV